MFAVDKDNVLEPGGCRQFLSGQFEQHCQLGIAMNGQD